MRCKLFFKISLSLVLVAGLIFASLWIFARSRLPQVSGKSRLPFLEKPVKVIRDQWGIPHIFAASEWDAMRAFGFVAAQDRLFQMDMHRRLANGELSEVVGKPGVKVDRIFRTLRLRRHAAEILSGYPENSPVIRSAKAYLQGLNHFIDTQPLPVEFEFLRYKPKHFELVEMLAFGGYMAYGFSEAFKGDLVYADLLRDVPSGKVDELRQGIDEGAPTISLRFPFSADHWDVSGWLHLFGEFEGSNSWVLSPQRTSSGKAVLANDPHIGFTNPSIWYEAHLKSPDFEIYGHYLSFLPFAILGHNRKISWALTMSEIDDTDFYQEKFNPENPGQVFYSGRWMDVTSHEETIHVRKSDDEKLQVRVTPHGSLIGNLLSESADPGISVKWQFQEMNNRVLDTFYEMAHAENWEQFKPALSKATSPGLNISYAGADGTIAWWTVGNIPIRPGSSRPDSVMDGASGKNEYLGYVPFEDHPHLVNPPSGVIVTANNKPSKKTAYPLHGYFQPPERAQRIEQLLAQKEKWSLEELKTLQTDQFELAAAEIVPELLKIIEPPGDQLERAAYLELKNWNGVSNRGSLGSTIYHQLNFRILEGAVLDEMGIKRFEPFSAIADNWHFYRRLIKNPRSLWWDDVSTKDHVETRQEIVNRAFHQSVADLKARFGSDVSQWRWGRMHCIEYVHPIGRQKPLNHIFNSGPFEAGGGYNEIDAMSYQRHNDSFNVVAGPSTRILVDFANPDHSFGINPLGNSGSFLSPHAHDQVEKFLNGEYRPQLLKDEEIQSAAEAVLELEP